VFSNPYVPEENITAFYSQLEDREYGTEAEGRSKNFNTIFKRIKRIREGGEKQGSPDDSLLDIGAAGGIFLDMAREKGYDIDGIEPSEFLVREAEERYAIKLFKGTVEEYVEEYKTKKKFSIITLLDILEHLVNPDDFMTKVDGLMKKNGLLVVVTPDVGSLAARLAGKRWWHYRVAHINFFNLASLRYLLEKHGYEIISKKRYIWNFSLFYLITRIFPGLKEKKSLQKFLKRVHLILPLFDSWEIYATKRNV
jgi:2-polyprenyl-3-methyl-5-hydroxy-6-metoxy-1,4-benzoquinol methylase